MRISRITRHRNQRHHPRCHIKLDMPPVILAIVRFLALIAGIVGMVKQQRREPPSAFTRIR